MAGTPREGDAAGPDLRSNGTRADPEVVRAAEVLGADGECGQDGMTDAGGHHGRDRAVVVGAEHNVDIDPGIDHAPMEHPLAGRVKLRHQWYAGKVLCRNGARSGAHRVLGRGDEDVGVLEQGEEMDAVDRLVARDEGDLQLAGAHQLHETVEVIGLAKPQVDGGVIGPELLCQGRKHSRRHALEGADRQSAGVAGLEGGNVSLRGVEPMQDRVGVLEDDMAKRREFDRFRAAWPVKEGTSDMTLQRRDLLTDRRLGATTMTTRTSTASTSTMTTSTAAATIPSFTEIAVRLDDEGLDAVVAELRPTSATLVAAARCGGLSGAVVEVLGSASTSDVVWFRAYCLVRGELAHVVDDLDLTA